MLYSVHLKATMMKVSDPIIFGHVVKAFFADVFDTYGDKIAEAGLTANDGLGAILAGLPSVEGGAEIAAAITADLARVLGCRTRTPTRASRTCTSPRTSSSMPRCPR